VKRSNTDRDVMWGTSVPNGGTTGQALIKASDADGDVSWGASIPNGGTTGQALIKNSDANGDVSWGNVNANDKVSKSGDTMTGILTINRTNVGESQMVVQGTAGIIYMYS